jgi:hypothetical protein
MYLAAPGTSNTNFFKVKTINENINIEEAPAWDFLDYYMYS